MAKRRPKRPTQEVVNPDSSKARELVSNQHEREEITRLAFQFWIERGCPNRNSRKRLVPRRGRSQVTSFETAPDRRQRLTFNCQLVAARVTAKGERDTRPEPACGTICRGTGEIGLTPITAPHFRANHSRRDRQSPPSNTSPTLRTWISSLRSPRRARKARCDDLIEH